MGCTARIRIGGVRPGAESIPESGARRPGFTAGREDSRRAQLVRRHRAATQSPPVAAPATAPSNPLKGGTPDEDAYTMRAFGSWVARWGARWLGSVEAAFRRPWPPATRQPSY